MSSAFLNRLRKLCLTLPGTKETRTWDHPNFRVADKIFLILGDEQRKPVLCVKVGKQRQKELIRDPRYTIAPYVGRFGWVNLAVGAKPDWNEITDLVLLSYRLIAPKRLVRQMEE